jgi:serine/threonine protein kinase
MAWPPQLPDRYLMWPRPERALVGRGTFGEVWRAKDQHQGVLVALKILRARDARVQTRMEREAALGAKVVHPNVIALYDMGRTPEGLPYLAFPMASDGNLRRILGTPPPWSQLLELLGDLLAALAALHSRGFLHLDVKLDNVLLHRAGARRRNVWLADLGVAVALYGEDHDERLIAGTIGYMPTEQLAGQHHLWGPPTDLFAFGALAYRLLCGELPFPEKEPLEAHGARYRPPATLPVIDGYVVPPGLDDVLLPLLHPSPRGRYDRAADVWRALLALPPVIAPEPTTLGDLTPIDPGSGFFVSPPGGETAQQSALWGEEHSSVGALLVATDRDEEIELTPLDVPAWHRPAPRPMPRTLVRPPTPKRLSNAASLLVHREIPMVGRDRELDLLWQAGRWVADRRHPAVFHIRGPRGIGRSRLAQEFTRMVEESGFGEGLHLPLAPTAGPSTGLRGAVRRLIHPHRDHAVYVNGVATLLARDRDVGIETCLDDARTLTDWLVPSEAQRPIDVARVVDLVAEHLSLRAWRGVAWLWIDDAQFAPAEDPLFALIERIYARGAPVLTILASSGTEPSTAVADVLRRHEKTSHDIELKALPERAATTLVQSYLPIEPELARQIGSETEGNPKYAREILIHWVRAGILVPVEGTDGAAPVWTKAKDAPAFPKDRATFAQQVLAHALGADASHLPALIAMTESDEGAPERVLASAAGEALDHLVVEGLVEVEQGRMHLVPPELADAVRAWPRDPAIDAQVHRDLADAWKAEGDDPGVQARVARHRERGA